MQNTEFLFISVCCATLGRVLLILCTSTLLLSRMESFEVRMSSLCSGNPIFPFFLSKASAFACMWPVQLQIPFLALRSSPPHPPLCFYQLLQLQVFPVSGEPGEWFEKRGLGPKLEAAWLPPSTSALPSVPPCFHSPPPTISLLAQSLAA